MEYKWILIIGLFSAGLAAGCGRQTRQPEPDRYPALAENQLKLSGLNKTELLQVFKWLTSPEERRGAAFLINTMPYPDLAAIKSDVLLEHIRYAYLARNKYHWLKDMPEEVFLHYVLPYRCAEEPIEAYRKYFYEQLDPIVSQAASMAEAIHQVNLWLGAPDKFGRRRVRFVQTESRDQGPLATLKSGYGRCEEMMIVYMAAARSVGIPCRSAWTPYWAICDNNHAWVEVWADGQWKPLGGCEPGEPWFEHPAKRAAAVYSAALGQPLSEPIYKTAGYASLINSTPNYSRTCKVNVSVLDENNNPASDATAVFSVFNWGSFRPFATRELNHDGRAEFIIGIGEYFLSAGQGDSRAWQTVKTEPEKTIDITLKLAKNNAPDGYLFLRYPTAEQAMQSFTITGLAPACLEPLTPSYQAPAEIHLYDEFSPTMHSALMALMEDYPQKDIITQKLISSGGNWPEISGAIKETSPELRRDMLWMISHLAHLETLEATKEFLTENVLCASEARQMADWQIPDDIYRAYVLSPLFEHLHLSIWRRELADNFIAMKKGTGANTPKNAIMIQADTITACARAVNNWVAANIKTNNDIGGRFSYLASPMDTLRSQVGNDYGIAVFTASLLRSLAVPARVKKDWVEFWDGAEWRPLYPLDPKNLGNISRDEKTASEYNAKPAGIKIILTRRGETEQTPREKTAVSRFQDGYWQYLNWNGLKQYGSWKALPPGQYLVTTGVRNSNGDAMVYCKQLEFKSEEGIVIEAPMDMPPAALSEDDLIVRHLKTMPDLILTGTDNAPYHLMDSLKKSNIILTFFSLDNEPSLRMLPLIDQVLPGAAKANTQIWGVYIDAEGKGKFLKDGRLNGLRFPILLDSDQKTAKQFIPDLEKNKASLLPSTLLISKSGKIVIWNEGYNMDIGRLIEFGLGLLPEGKTTEEIKMKEPAIRREPFNAPEKDYLGEADRNFNSGRYQEAIDLYKKSIELSEDNALAWYNIACAYSRLKQTDGGLEALKQALESGWSETKWMDEDPDLQHLRQDSRYKEINK